MVGCGSPFFHISERHDQIQKDLPDRWIYGISRKEKTEKTLESCDYVRLHKNHKFYVQNSTNARAIFIKIMNIIL